MIEDGLFLALGFCVAVVLALACLPLVWARALRLTRQRLELLVPWSRDEIDAERDGLRAQAAVERRRLEQALERGQAALAARAVELGRRAVDLAGLEKARDALRQERGELMADLEGRRRALDEADGQRFAAEKALHDADRRIETDAAEARVQADLHRQAVRLAEARSVTIAALQSQVAALDTAVTQRDGAIARLDAALAASAGTQAALAAAHARLGDTLTDLRREHGEAGARAVAQDRALQDRGEALAAAEARLIDLERAMTEKDERLRALQARFDALSAQLAASEAAGAAQDGEDARLRGAIAAFGTEALVVLGDAAAGRGPEPVEPRP